MEKHKKNEEYVLRITDIGVNGEGIGHLDDGYTLFVQGAVPGDEIRVETPSGDVKGSVSLIGTAADPQKGLFKITAQITTVTDKSLLSNTSVSLSLVTNSVKDQILIPFDAVYYDDDQAYVFVAEKGEESDKAVRRDVIAGAYNNDMITILEGLSEGDQVITTWGAGLKDGASIEIIHPQTGTQPDTQTDAQ